MKIGGEPLFLYWGGIGARSGNDTDAGGSVQMRCKGAITPNSRARPQARGRLLPSFSVLLRAEWAKIRGRPARTNPQAMYYISATHEWLSEFTLLAQIRRQEAPHRSRLPPA